MRRRFEWTPPESLPDRAEVLRLQGLPRDGSASPRIAALYEQALAAYLAVAEPRAVVVGLSHEEFAEVFRGEGRNAEKTPLADVYPRAVRLALFVATLGERVSAEIRDLFARNEPALAAMLDSVASAAADRLADLLGPLAWAGEPRGDAWRALPYSPGYCGWDVTGQRRLFAHLQPGEIGVTLGDSCLMQPLKSVSGVLVAGPPEIYEIDRSYPFCGECRDATCRGRIAS
jgi:hypothetical protein